MIREFQSTQGSVADRKFAIVVSKYNLEITDKLRSGAIQALQANGVADDHISVLWVPGAWELPLGAKQALEALQPDAVICLGCVIRGETTHDQYINRTVSQLLGSMSIETGKPIAFGLLTCNTWDQAAQRAGGSVGNKGIESVDAALAMLRLGDSLAQ